MEVRSNQQSMMNEMIRNSQLRTNRIAELQRQLATGVRISKPSDDPSKYASLLHRKATSARMDVDLDNMASARNKLNAGVSSLVDASEVLERASKQIALQAPQSLDREILALEVDALLDQMIAIANHQEGGLQLFAGAASTAHAFSVEEDTIGRPLEVQYEGASLRSQVVIGPNTTVDTIYSGAEIFLSSERDRTEYSGDTGAQAGVGTDSARGQGELLVRHSLTTYADPSVTAGASSVGGDTIVGDAGTHELTIEIDPVKGHVVRLNGGAAFAFDGASTDLEVRGPRNEVAFVNLSAVSASFTGTVAITANGTVSVDGGATETAIDFSANQQLVDSVTGLVTNVDTSEIHSSGTDQVEYVGTANVFESLMQLRDLLREADDLTTDELDYRIAHRIQDLDRAQSHVLRIVGEQSVSLQNLDALELRMQELQLGTVEAVAEIENADLPEVILNLQSEQNLLQFIYATTGTIFDNSLLPFIR